MKHFRVILTALTMFMVVFATESLAQRGMKGKSNNVWEMGSNYNKMFDPKTVETVIGEVIAVDKITPEKGMSYGVHLMLKTDKETISIHLGPGWYFEKQNMKIALKDKIEIKGSRIIFEGTPAVIAAEVKKGTSILTLRDEKGIPVWSGRRHK